MSNVEPLPLFLYDVVAYYYTLTHVRSGREVLDTSDTYEDAMRSARDHIYELAGKNYHMREFFPRRDQLGLAFVCVEPRLYEATARRF